MPANNTGLHQSAEPATEDFPAEKRDALSKNTPDGLSQDIDRLQVQESQNTNIERYLRKRRSLVLGIGIPVLFVITILEALLLLILLTQGQGAFDFFLRLTELFGWVRFPVGTQVPQFQYLPGDVQRNIWLVAVGLACAATWVAALSMYLFLVEYPLALARANAAEVSRKRFDEQVACSDTVVLDGLLQELSHTATRVFLENDVGRSEAYKLRDQTSKELHKEPETGVGQAPILLSQLYELIARGQGTLQAERTWRYAAAAIILAYIAGLGLIVMLVGEYGSNATTPIPVFGVPLSVVMWAAAGSLAAILYRFYTSTGQIRFNVEVRWLIARPVIGIIMGAVVYLALISGLVLIGAGPSSTTINPLAPPGRLEFYYVVAFLAGFSDKFYVGVINLLTEKFQGGSVPPSPPTTPSSPAPDESESTGAS
jgi:hypothetical protein